jgi:hypothetical protein
VNRNRFTGWSFFFIGASAIHRYSRHSCGISRGLFFAYAVWSRFLIETTVRTGVASSSRMVTTSASVVPASIRNRAGHISSLAAAELAERQV